ncbi:MAG: 50S ribosome-binding GTPase [Anaerolineales bacterium]|jgi:ribosome-interacting GTPase 1
MPTNLPPEYFEAEERHKAAKTQEEKITTLEDLISTIPKHKGTDKLRADLRRRLSKLRERSQGKKQLGRQDSVFHIDREGAGQAVLVGLPNVGKSALVNALTNASPEISEAPFTTWVPTPGMMEYEGVQIQLVDTPPLNREFMEPQLMDLIRRTDILLLVVDIQDFPIEQLEESLQILDEYRIRPIEDEGQPTGGRRMVSLPMFVLVNKIDDERGDEDFDVLCELLCDEQRLLPVSAQTGRHLEDLKRSLFERLSLVRIYPKPVGEEPDMNRPFVMKQGATVEDFAGKIHKDFLKNLKAARVWGSSVHDGQMVGRDYVLSDGDVVELRI